MVAGPEDRRDSLGNRMMWAPIVLTPFAAAAGIGGVIDKRLAKTALAIASLAVVANGVQGTYLHLRGIAQRPGGWRHARYTYSHCDNDRALMAAGQGKMTAILEAAGAQVAVTIKRYAHLVGGARMGFSREDGVVDRDPRSFAVPNLYITDGSVLPTQGSANPALTIMALAARCADHLTSANRGLTSVDGGP